MSSLSASMLGLTDSPLPRRSDQSSPSQSPAQATMRPRASQQQLKSSQANLRTPLSQPNSRPTSRLANGTTTQVPSRPTTTTPVKSVNPQAKSASPATTPTTLTRSNATATSQVARPTQARPALRAQSAQQKPQAQPRAVTRKPPSSPAATDHSFAEEWEAELVENAKKLDLAPPPPAAAAAPRSRAGTGELAEEKEERRQRDLDWERMGAWEMGRDSAREAEDRVRREAGRDIAYPPSLPRVPVRAAPTGTTSIHIGVRPRLHPSRASDSMLRNQPDPEVPLPLFSPAGANAELPDTAGTVRGSYNTRYDAELFEKAKREYEEWLGKKAEREGGIDEESGGTRDWEPRGRQVARPGAVDGIAHSDEYERSPHPLTAINQMALQPMQAHAQAMHMGMHMSQGQVQGQAQAQAQPQGQAQAQPRLKADATVERKENAKDTPPPAPVFAANQDDQNLDAQAQAQAQMMQMQQWGYPYHMMYDPQTQTQAHVQAQGMDGYGYPEAGYWDPYWWGMAGIGMGMGDQQGVMQCTADTSKKVQFAEPDPKDPQSASTPVTPEENYAE